MKPALQAFLQKIKDKLEFINMGDDVSDPNNPLKKLIAICDDFNNPRAEDQEANAKKFIKEFHEVKKTLEGKSLRINPVDQIESEVVFPLQLLLHERAEQQTQEIKMSSLMEHFAPFLGCPFKIQLVDDKVQFVLFYADENTELGKKQRLNGKRFYNTLSHLEIVSVTDRYKKTNNNRGIITVAPDQVKNLLRLAQFDLISEENAPKKREDLEKKLKFILTELIETEVSFSKAAKDLGQLLDRKIKAFDDKTDPLIKITQNDRAFLAQAAAYYREIGNNPYPWFGKGVDAESLKNKSLEEMLTLCNKWYERLDDKDAAISKRLACLRWITVNYSRLDQLVNPQKGEKSLLNLTDKIVINEEGVRQSEKSVGSQNLITPVQRLPRILLLTSELKNCIAGFSKTGSFTESLNICLNSLNGLLSEWLWGVKRTNSLTGLREAASNASFAQKLLRGLEEFIEGTKVESVDLSATAMVLSIDMRFKALPPLSAFRSRVDQSTVSDANASATSAGTTSVTTTETSSSSAVAQSMDTDTEKSFAVLPGFDEALTRTVLFAGQESYVYYERQLFGFHLCLNLKIFTGLIGIERKLPQGSVAQLKELVSNTANVINNSENINITAHFHEIIRLAEAISVESDNSDLKNEVDAFKAEEIAALRWLISEKYVVQPIENADNAELEKRLKAFFGEEIQIKFPSDTSDKLELLYGSLTDEVTIANADRIKRMLHLFSIKFEEVAVNKTISIASKDLEAIYQLMHFHVSIPQQSVPTLTTNTAPTGSGPRSSSSSSAFSSSSSSNRSGGSLKQLTNGSRPILEGTPIQAQSWPIGHQNRYTAHSKRPSSSSKLPGALLLTVGILFAIAAVLFMIFMPHVSLFLGIGIGMSVIGGALGVLGIVKLAKNDNPVIQQGQDGGGPRVAGVSTTGSTTSVVGSGVGNPSVPVLVSGNRPDNGGGEPTNDGVVKSEGGVGNGISPNNNTLQSSNKVNSGALTRRIPK